MIISPKNKTELIESLNLADDKTFLLAGGTDLIIKLNNSKIVDYNIIDLTKVEGLNFIVEDQEYLRIGALVTMAELLENYLIRSKYQALYGAAYELGSTIIRNRATIAGNVCNASQSADVGLVLFSYDARIKVLDSQGQERIVPIDDFVVGREKTVLKANEAVIEILIPKKDRHSAFVKVGARKAVTISKLSCSLDSQLLEGKFKNVRVFLGAVGVKPVEAKELENYFENKGLDEINISQLQDLAFNEVEKAIPSRSSKYYKRQAVQGVVEDLVLELRGENERA